MWGGMINYSQAFKTVFFYIVYTKRIVSLSGKLAGKPQKYTERAQVLILGLALVKGFSVACNAHLAESIQCASNAH